MSTGSPRPLVLLVEHDALAARGLARMLSDDGFQVERVSDGAAAIARLAKSPSPDALITDLFIPYADGLTVLRFARTRNPRLVAVVVTSHSELLDRGPDSINPAPTILGKPLDYEVLAQALRELLPRAA